MAEVDSVISKLVLDISQFSKGLKTAHDQMDQFAKGSGKAVEGLGQQLTKLGGLLKAGLGFAGIDVGARAAFAAIKELSAATIGIGEDLKRASIQTGISVEDLSALRLALELNDSSLATLSSGLRIMQVNLAEAARGSGEAAEVLGRMGITVADMERAAGDPQGFLELFAKRLFAIDDAGGRAEAASRVFGRSVLELMPFLQDLSERGLKGVQAEARRLGVIFTDDMAEAADAFGDNMTRLKIIAQGLAAVVGGPLLTALNQAAIAMGLLEETGLQASVSAITGQINQLKQSQAELQAGLKFEGGTENPWAEPGNWFMRQMLGARNPEEARQKLAEVEQALQGLQKVRDQLTKPAPAGGGGVTGPTGIDKITKALEVQLAQITKNSQVMGQHYDALAAKEGAYRQAIEATTKLQGKEAVAPEDPRLKAFGTQQAALVTQLKAREDAEKASHKAISDADSAAKAAQRERQQELETFIRDSNARLTRSDEERVQAAGEVWKSVETPMETFTRELTSLQDLQANLPVEIFDRAVQQLVNDLAQATGNTQRWKDLQAQAAQVLASSPIGAYNAEVARLDELLQAGLISQEAFNTALNKANIALDTVDDHVDKLHKSWKELGNVFENAFEGAVVEGRSLGDVFEGLLKDMERLVLKALVLEPLMKSLSGLTEGKSVGELLRSGASAVAGWFKGPPGDPWGFPELQRGGLFSRPTLAMIGEAGPEIVSPVHKMEAWMKGVMQGMEPGGSSVVVNVINNMPNAKVTTQQKTDPQGHRSLDLLIDEAVAQQLGRSGSASQRTLRSVYGISGPVLTGR